MTKEFDPAQLDVVAFAQAGAALQGVEPLRNYTRLQSEALALGAAQPVQWTATGAQREVRGGPSQLWLHLKVHAVLPLTCQRCLAPVEVTIEVDRAFRFVADEATAEALDDESEEDLLVISRSFDLPGLIEDELLMEMPVVPRHTRCPTEVKLVVADPEFEAQPEGRPNPFAVLQQLKTAKGGRVK